LRKTGKEYTPEALFDELVQDLVYFRQSGGGVTFSGGEPMLQATFMKETAGLLKEQGIHIAMETNLTVSWDKYEKVLPVVDLIMADIKMIDEEEHKKWTGSGNQRILENIKKLDAANKPYILRTPVIPGVNDSPQRMEKPSEI
jgi:pyruvate formate lyase activating enzyme